MGHWSWCCDGCDFDNDGAPEIYIACGMLTNNSRTDLMSYFYRQVVAKSPPSYKPAPAYENGWNAINQLIREEYQLGRPRAQRVLRAPRGALLRFLRGSAGSTWRKTAALSRSSISMATATWIWWSRAGWGRRFASSRTIAERAAAPGDPVLRGTKSNRDAIGARVEVDGQAKWLVAGSAYLSQHTKRLHFGLGERKRAEKVRIDVALGNGAGVAAARRRVPLPGHRGRGGIPARSRSRPQGLPADMPSSRPTTALAPATAWLREPVPLPEKRIGPALLVLHAGEPLPQYGAPTQVVDLRSAPSELVAAYAIFRRYLFDHRVDLETPLWMLIDSAGRVRKIYASAPAAAAVEADLRTVEGPAPDARSMPFDGVYYGQPTRDYFKIGGAMWMAGYGEQALPYLEEALQPVSGQYQDSGGDWPHPA